MVKRRVTLPARRTFFPFSFRKSLLALIAGVETVLLEGPLDEGNMDLVRNLGLEEAGTQSFLEGLDQETMTRINREFESEMPSAGNSLLAYMEIFVNRKEPRIHPI